MRGNEPSNGTSPPQVGVGIGHGEPEELPAKAGKKLTILFFNNFFNRPPETELLSCDRCEFTTDRQRLRHSAAVIFHIPSMKGIRSVRKYPGQLWVGWSMESLISYPLLADETFMKKFDLRMTYEQSADIWCPYLPPKCVWDQALATQISAKTASASTVMLQSDTFDLSGRNEFASELMALMKIDSYGRFLNNRQLETADRGHKTKMRLIASYKFCIGFENTIAPDYVTEKFFEPLTAGTVPVYRGAPNVDLFAPGPHSFIDASKFSSAKDLAEFLIYLDQNDDAYRQYFAWREAGLSASFEKLLSRCSGEAFCRLYNIVADRQAAYHPPVWMQCILARRVWFGL